MNKSWPVWRGDVWRYASNCILVKKYSFFTDTGDINDPHAFKVLLLLMSARSWTFFRIQNLQQKLKMPKKNCPIRKYQTSRQKIQQKIRKMKVTRHREHHLQKKLKKTNLVWVPSSSYCTAVEVRMQVCTQVKEIRILARLPKRWIKKRKKLKRKMIKIQTHIYIGSKVY